MSGATGDGGPATIDLMESMKASLNTLFAAFLSFGLLAHAAVAQEAVQGLPSEDKTVAIVNGYEIKTSEVRMAFDDVIGQLPNLPPKLRYPFVVEFLVERHLLAQLANKQGIAEGDDYKRRLAAYQAKALRDSYLATVVSPAIKEDEIKVVYDEEAKKVTDAERIRARHILVASEKEANDIIGKLKGGAKFEDMAKQYSLDGSKDFGGDLGYFTAPEMVAEFSKAAFALKVGDTSKPVKTDFGWHIIKLEDRKQGAAQPYDQVKDAIRNVLVRKKVQDTLAGLKDSAKVEIVDDDLKKIADEAAKQRKAIFDQQQKANIAGGENPDAAGGDATGGKGDLLAPADSTGGEDTQQ
jgi:peptidyl-prolyl cis-trans isomerase C